MKRILLAAVTAAVIAGAIPAQAADVVADWTKVSAPAAPSLKSVTVDPKTTALLMLDFMNQNCGKRPACVATIPAMKKLLAAARAAKATVVYSIIANTTPADVIKDVAPEASEAHVKGGPDKFVNTDLDKILKDKGIKTVIAVGTSSNGAVLYTASGAAFRGMNVVIPVDGMSAVMPYADKSTVFTFMNAPTVSAKTTLTRSDMIKF
ncbi:MAG TPA: isochorismatase family protein [Pseudolabrys sp.]|jgi:nicotinamidase-related amidase|nr:isochorismatase family protein [Pseudolabrys sp.]